MWTNKSKGSWIWCMQILKRRTKTWRVSRQKLSLSMTFQTSKMILKSLIMNNLLNKLNRKNKTELVSKKSSFLRQWTIIAHLSSTEIQKCCTEKSLQPVCYTNQLEKFTKRFALKKSTCSMFWATSWLWTTLEFSRIDLCHLQKVFVRK